MKKYTFLNFTGFVICVIVFCICIYAQSNTHIRQNEVDLEILQCFKVDDYDSRGRLRYIYVVEGKGVGTDVTVHLYNRRLYENCINHIEDAVTLTYNEIYYKDEKLFNRDFMVYLPWDESSNPIEVKGVYE